MDQEERGEQEGEGASFFEFMPLSCARPRLLCCAVLAPPILIPHKYILAHLQVVDWDLKESWIFLLLLANAISAGPGAVLHGGGEGGEGVGLVAPTWHASHKV